MRRETYNIKGGIHGILLHPETEQEGRPTPVERGILLAMLTTAVGVEAAEKRIGNVRILERVIDGYGAHVNLSMPGPDRESDPDINGLKASLSEPGIAMAGANPSAMVDCAGCRSQVSAVLLGSDGSEYSIDIHPIYGEALGREPVERLLFESLDNVKIAPS